MKSILLLAVAVPNSHNAWALYSHAAAGSIAIREINHRNIAFSKIEKVCIPHV